MADIFDDTYGDQQGNVMGMDVGNSQPEPEDLAVFKLTLKKKKKKKKPKVVVAAAAAAPGVTATDGKKQVAWQGSDRDYTYAEMLDRVYQQILEKNPNLQERKRHSMPPPSLNRVGTKKTMWNNFAQICKIMKRTQAHVQSFFVAELGVEGALDSNSRVILKGRFMAKAIESLLKRYIVEYVTCHMCRNPDTTLTRDPVTRLYFMECESCSSSRSVAPIKSGYHATNRVDRRAKKTALLTTKLA